MSVTDFTVRVFDTHSGGLLHRLTTHAENVHVLECHPTEPALAVSASYDGNLILWDLERGVPLHTLNRWALGRVWTCWVSPLFNLQL